MQVTVQIACQHDTPSQTQIQTWATAAVRKAHDEYRRGDSNSNSNSASASQSDIDGDRGDDCDNDRVNSNSDDNGNNRAIDNDNNNDNDIDKSAMQQTIRRVRQAACDEVEMTVRIVGVDEMRALNHRYRNRPTATDVLSFRCDADTPSAPLGDVVICASIVAAHADSTRRTPLDHWAHLVIHGTLHLCGFDHQHDREARRMAQLEDDILAEFGLRSG